MKRLGGLLLFLWLFLVAYLQSAKLQSSYEKHGPGLLLTRLGLWEDHSLSGKFSSLSKASGIWGLTWYCVITQPVLTNGMVYVFWTLTAFQDFCLHDLCSFQCCIRSIWLLFSFHRKGNKEMKKNEELTQNLLDKMEDFQIWLQEVWPQSPGFSSLNHTFKQQSIPCLQLFQS